MYIMQNTVALRVGGLLLGEKIQEKRRKMHQHRVKRLKSIVWNYRNVQYFIHKNISNIKKMYACSAYACIVFKKVN